MKKLSLTIAAAVLAVSVSGAAAFADEVENAASKQFAVLEGIPAQAMTSRDLESVVGSAHQFGITVQLFISSPDGILMSQPHVDVAACHGITNSRGFTTSACP